MREEREQTHLWRWLAPAIALHSLLTVSVLVHVHTADIPSDFYENHDDAVVLIQNEPPPLQNEPPSPTTPAPEPVPFFIDLNKNSTFGAAQEHSDLATIEEKNTTPIAEKITNSEPEQPSSLESSTPPDTSSPSNNHIGIGDHEEQRTQSHRQELSTPADKTAAPVTKKMTLTRLAEGFLNYTKTSRSQPIDLHTKDLRYAAYFQKVGWFLQNSFHLNDKLITLDEPVRETVEVRFIVKKDGSLSHTTILTKSPNPLTKHLLHIIKQAAPFPPLPAHLNRNELEISFPLSINGATGKHQYYFTFTG